MTRCKKPHSAARYFTASARSATIFRKRPDARWLPIRVGTDVALMLALAHTLLAENLHDRDFLARYCSGFDVFENYLLGSTDATPKDAAWASDIVGMPAQRIVELARSLVGKRTLITVSHSLQRAQYGEQPVWMGAVLAAMLGQIGPARRRL